MPHVQTPPPFVPTPERIERLIRVAHGPLEAEPGGRYLHWDELRRRPAPGGISHEDWWARVKLARFGNLKHVHVPGEPGGFSFAVTDAVQRLAHQLDRDASGRIELPEDISNAGTRDRYVVSSLIEEAYRSSQLEGASTTRVVAKEMIRNQRAPRTTSERMILNNFQAMEWVRAHQREPLTPAAVLELHAIVTRGTLDSAEGGGRLRRADENVRVVDTHSDETVHVPPAAALLPDRLAALCAFANSSSDSVPFIHPVVRAILVHFWLAYDHPFVDGNGRTARALFYWSMLAQGYWLTEFISISRVIRKARAQYDTAFVYAETDANDTTYFLLNQLKMMQLAVAELSTYLERKAKELRDVEQRLRGRDDLNHRQLAALGHLLRHPSGQISIESHKASHRVAYQTARTDLLGLVDRGFAQLAKVGKKMVFSPAADLERRLRAPGVSASAR